MIKPCMATVLWTEQPIQPALLQSCTHSANKTRQVALHFFREWVNKPQISNTYFTTSNYRVAVYLTWLMNCTPWNYCAQCCLLSRCTCRRVKGVCNFLCTNNNPSACIEQGGSELVISVFSSLLVFLGYYMGIWQLFTLPCLLALVSCFVQMDGLCLCFTKWTCLDEKGRRCNSAQMSRIRLHNDFQLPNKSTLKRIHTVLPCRKLTQYLL